MRTFADDYPELVGAPRFQEAYGEQIEPDEYGLDCAAAGEAGRSMTRQSEKDDADINVIVARYHETGFLPEIQDLGVFADVSEMGDYRDVVNRIAEVDRVFSQLPPTIRARFNHDPAAFIDFMNEAQGNADVLKEAVALGLVVDPDAAAGAAPVDEVAGPGVQGRDPVTGQFTSPK